MVTMENTIQELRQIITEYAEKISSIPDAELTNKPLPHKWSKKEVVGHLIDSAQNNLRRFIAAQVASSPPHIVYDQDFWVESNNYAEANKEDIILLWRLINDRICSILAGMPERNYTKLCKTGDESSHLRSLAWLAADYVKHMKHHLNQIIPNSFDITYP